MKTDKRLIILTEVAADQGRLRAVLGEWGYGDNEIHHVLQYQRIDRRLNRGEKDDSIHRGASRLIMLQNASARGGS
jgi:hypothetical protein